MNSGRIVAAALQLKSGAIVVLRPPYRHSDILCSITKEQAAECRQGFLTSEMVFTDRSIAYTLAQQAGQLLPQNRPGHTPTPGTLYTEDLW